MAFTCQICFEERSSRLELPLLSTGNGDMLRPGDCNHPVCCECTSKYVRVRVEEQRVFNLRCPLDGCRNEIYEKDLQRLVDEGALSADVYHRFGELRARDFSARVMSFDDMVPQTEDDVQLLLRLREMRLCPRCKLVMQRSEGCNSFFCICGEHFNYATAERPVCSGVKKSKWVIDLARGQQLTLATAAKFSGDIHLFKKSRRTAAQLGLSCEQAMVLHLRAQEGNIGARTLIRKGRGTGPQPLEETRIADDGFAYTRGEFMRHYGGKHNGRWHWEACASTAVRPIANSNQRQEICRSSALAIPLTVGQNRCIWVSLAKVLEADVKSMSPNAPAKQGALTCMKFIWPSVKSERIVTQVCRPKAPRTAVAGNARANPHCRLGRRNR